MKDVLSGWPFGSNGGGGSPSAAAKEQILLAGAFKPLSTNTNTTFTDKEITVGDDVIYNTIDFPLGSSDKWCCPTFIPTGWTSEKIKFISHFIISDTISLPGAWIFDLDVEYLTNEFQLNTMSYQTISTPSLDAVSTSIPLYYVTAESSELTISGSPTDVGALSLRIGRGADTESNSAFFVGLKLMFV